MPRGKYVVIEGPDGAGKSTLVENICKELARTEGPKGVPVCFPSKGPIGSLIRQVLMGAVEVGDVKALMFMFAADGIERNGYIESLLEDGVNVICDRHPTLSGRVFQLDHHKEADIEAVYGATELATPDTLFIVDVLPETTVKRCEGRSKYADVIYETENLERLRTLRGRYKLMGHMAAQCRWAKKVRFLQADEASEKELVDEVIDLGGLR